MESGWCFHCLIVNGQLSGVSARTSLLKTGMSANVRRVRCTRILNKIRVACNKHVSLWLLLIGDLQQRVKRVPERVTKKYNYFKELQNVLTEFYFGHLTKFSNSSRCGASRHNRVI